MTDQSSSGQTKKSNKRLLQGQEPDTALRDWRTNVLDIFLPLASIAILPLVVQVVLQWRRHPEIAWQGVAIFLFLVGSLLGWCI